MSSFSGTSENPHPPVDMQEAEILTADITDIKREVGKMFGTIKCPYPDCPNPPHRYELREWVAGQVPIEAWVADRCYVCGRSYNLADWNGSIAASNAYFASLQARGK